MKRRVLYVENGIGYGGAAICLRHLVRNLDPARYEPCVVTGRTGPEYREIAREAHWRHITDRHFDAPGARRRIASSPLLARIAPLRWFALQLVARLDDLLNFLPFFLGFLWTAWRFKPHLIHANNEPLCNRAALLAARALRIPSVCHVRGQPEGSALMARMYHLPDHFIPVSHWIARAIAPLGATPERSTVVYDGIALDALNLDADGGAWRAVHAVPAHAFAVGLVGLLIPWKGQGIFLDAARRLRDAIPDLRMLVIGGTPVECANWEAELRRRVQDEGLRDIVVFTGHVGDMCPVYNGLDVVVSASTSPEPLGTVVIECMAMGRPLVAPNHGGGAEMNEHGVTALLFEPGNADALADAILRLHRDRALAAALGQAARTKALRTFAVAEHVAGVEAVYDRVLKKSEITGC